MALVVEDLINLRNGAAPINLNLVCDMTLGTDIWLDRFIPYYLDRFIPAGGSKVKVLLGSEGSGKSHLLRYIQMSAQARHYTAVYLSAHTAGPKLCDIPNLYRLIASTIDMDALITELSRKVAESLGYGAAIYSGRDKLLPYVMEEGYGAPDSAREIRMATARLLKNADLSPACFTCIFTLLKDRLIADDLEGARAAKRWFYGEKLERFERRDSGLFETLQNATARRWLDSLLKLITLSGQQGLVVLIDDLDVLYERSPETGRYLYTPANVKDTYELFRQLIDDADLLQNFLLVLAGRRAMLEDDRRGIRSYEALWMRLQTGLVPTSRFNPLSDIVDTDAHLKALGDDFPARLTKHLSTVFNQYGLKKKPRDPACGTLPSPALKTVVINSVFLTEQAQMGGVQ
ncbi:MAG: DUF2791 family P-loop domain-containing protein [Ruminococcaceae bacterium]|nr:DUF2791 family P-loop domain-containing protein [Oscillospiraceae bacterium]